MKIKDEIVLYDWVHRIVIPEKLRKEFEKHIPENIKDRVIYIRNDCGDIWDWSEKVYCVIEKT
jgi:nicotinic acid phosphoribosyltransferase